MKLTDKAIAKYFNTTPQTLGNWKRSKIKGLNERYKALKNHLASEQEKKEK